MFDFLTKLFRSPKQSYPYSGFPVGGLLPSTNYTSEDMLQAYQSVGWWHAVVFRIALGMSEVSWTLFDVSIPQKPKQIFKHPILDLLHLANPFQTSEELIALDTIYMECLGESFWVLNYNAIGEPAEIILPYPTLMQVVPSEHFPFVKGYIYGREPNRIPLDVNQVIHFKYPNPTNQFRGLGQASAIGVNLSAEKNADKWVDQFFYNSARPDGVIQFDYTLSDEQFDKLKKQWSEKYKGVNKAHQVALLEGGGQYVQIQNAVKDMDFPNLKQKNRDIILGIEGMPLSVMGISENVNKSEAETGDYTFARWLLKPRLNWKKAKLQEQLVPKFRNSQNLKLGFEEIVPETAEQRRLDAESGMRAGYLTVNEARAATGKDPLPDNVGDVLLVPLNLIPTPVSGRETTPSQLAEEPKSKGLTSDQRRLHWERFAQKTERQEGLFRQVFSKVYDDQKDSVVDTYGRTHELPDTLDDEATARKFEPVLQLVYSSGFEDALPKQEEILDEHALEWIATRSLFLAKSINLTTLEALRLELRVGFAEGESIQQITKRIAGYFDSTKQWKAERVARSEIISASNEGALYRYEQAGVDKAIFTVSFGACPVCEELDGKEYPVTEAHGVIPVHPNCLLPDNEVMPLGLVSVSQASYKGQAIEITTRRGNRLTVTPNHPVLTPGGFLKAKFLKEGDYVISSFDSQRMLSSIYPYDEQRPTAIEDIWQTLSNQVGMMRATVPVTSKDFHSEARAFDGNVDVIYPNCFLLSQIGDAFGTKHANQNILNGRYTQLSHFDSSGMAFLFGDGFSSPPNSQVCPRCQRPLFVRTQTSHSNKISLTTRAGLDASGKKTSTNRTPISIESLRKGQFGFSSLITRNDVLSRQGLEKLTTGNVEVIQDIIESPYSYIPLATKFLRRFASLVTPDEIISVWYFQYSGHVYDLQSLQQLYISGGVAVKNCRCVWLGAV